MAATTDLISLAELGSSQGGGGSARVNRIAGTAIGRAVRRLTRLRGSAGQALPGLVVESLVPRYLATMLAELPEGVVIVTGTNGKTTTTKMIVQLLEFNGKRVITNPTGSNLTRGVISSLALQATRTGRLPFDIGVFELDEAYAAKLVEHVRPRLVLALNVHRDQLDRFGELDRVARLIGQTMLEAEEGVVLNRDDPRLVSVARQFTTKVPEPPIIHFGVAPELRGRFPTDDELLATPHVASVPEPGRQVVELTGVNGQSAAFGVDDRRYEARLQLSGHHNCQNAAAALAVVHALLPNVDPALLVAQLSAVRPAFGRGERFRLANGSTIQLDLVKNPASFRQVVASCTPARGPVMFAINDDFADGRDVSWLWDVDFSPLGCREIRMTSGSRAVDMALRLSYDGIAVGRIEPDIDRAVREFCKARGSKLVAATYTAMRAIHERLVRLAGRST